MLHAPSDLSRVTSSDILTEAGLSEEIICTLKKKKKKMDAVCLSLLGFHYYSGMFR